MSKIVRHLSILIGLGSLVAFTASPPPAHAERIKDMAQVQGVRTNQLVGYGLVVGLDGTGDQTSQAPFTIQSLTNMLAQLGVVVPTNVTPQLKTGAKMLSESVRADSREGDIGTELGALAKQHPDVVMGSYPFMDENNAANTHVVVRSRDPQKLASAKQGVEAMLVRVKAGLAAAKA